MTFSLVILLILFGWVLTASIVHSSQLLAHYDLAAQRHHIRVALTTFMWLLFPTVALGAWMIVGRTLRPLSHLSRQAEEASSTRLVAPSSDQEMVELVGTINGLLDRVEATADAKSQFYAAASHELRTPLHALNGHIENALSRERTSDEYRDALVEAQKQTLRLTSLTRDILTLHQLQAQHFEAGEFADVLQSVNTVVEELGPLTDARGLSIRLDHGSNHRQAGRQSFADMCVRNLVENAVRYSVPDTNVSITLSENNLHIENSVAENTHVDTSQACEPFASGSGGNGLGLAICRAAAQANGWKLELRQTNGLFIAILQF